MDTQQNPLLQETLDQIRGILGSRLDSLRVERAAIGLFFSGVKLSNGAGGIAFTPIDAVRREGARHGCAKGLPMAGNLAGKPVLRCLDDLFSDDTLPRLLGVAALSALTRSCCELMYEDAPEAHIGLGCFEHPDFPAGGRTVIIGRGVPIPKVVFDKASSVAILHSSAEELCEERREHFVPLEQAQARLSEADLVVITGHTLCDSCLHDYMSRVRPEAVTVVADPSIGLLPGPFFSRGVRGVSSAVVTRPDRFLDSITQGGSIANLVGHSVERALMISPASRLRASPGGGKAGGLRIASPAMAAR